MVIKPEDRRLLVDFVNNLKTEQRREILNRLLKSILNNKEEMEKSREQQLDGDLAKDAPGRVKAA
jgi:hypothetical protein